jgi:hypothetical protein
MVFIIQVFINYRQIKIKIFSIKWKAQVWKKNKNINLMNNYKIIIIQKVQVNYH